MVPDDTSLSNPEYASWLLREISPTIAKILSDAEKQAEKTLRVRESQIRSLYIKLATDRVLYEEDLAEKLKK